MSDNWCRECRLFHRPDAHKPLWRVVFPDAAEDEAVTVRAFDEIEAAEEAAEKDDAESAECSIIQRGGTREPAKVWRDEDYPDGAPALVDIVAEAVPQYTGRRVQSRENQS